MQQFNQAEYLRRKAAAQRGSERKPVEFLNNYLKKDGDRVIVRFPYATEDDFLYDSVHKVEDYPGAKFGHIVECLGENCPLCAKGIKRNNRFFVKLVVYVATATGVELKAVVWDRPAAFGDIDLRAKMDNYGDLTDCLFSIVRSGSGKDTRYNIDIITNKNVYPDTIYRKDFSCLEDINPSKILCKSMKTYNKALVDNGFEPLEGFQVDEVVEEVAEDEFVAESNIEQALVAPTPVEAIPTPSVLTTSVSAPTYFQSTAAPRPNRYKF